MPLLRLTIKGACASFCNFFLRMLRKNWQKDFALDSRPRSTTLHLVCCYLVTRNAMVAADELIVPVIPNRSSLKGFTNIQKCVNSVRRNKRLNPNLRIAGIVVNMFDGRTSLSRGVVNELPSIARAANTKMFHTIIRKCEAVNKAQSANVSIFDYDPNCNAVADFTDFVNEYLEGEDY